MSLKESIDELNKSHSLTEDMDVTKFSLGRVLAVTPKDRNGKIATYALILSSMSDDLKDDDFPNYFSRQLKVLSRLLLKMVDTKKTKSISSGSKNDE